MESHPYRGYLIMTNLTKEFVTDKINELSSVLDNIEDTFIALKRYISDAKDIMSELPSEPTEIANDEIEENKE